MNTGFGEVTKELEAILQASPGKERHRLARALCTRRVSLGVQESSAGAFIHPEGAQTIGRISETAGLAVSFCAMVTV